MFSLHELSFFNFCKISCLQLARAFGGRKIIAVDIDGKKLEKARALGASHTVNGAKENVPEKIKVSNNSCLVI